MTTNTDKPVTVYHPAFGYAKTLPTAAEAERWEAQGWTKTDPGTTLDEAAETAPPANATKADLVAHAVTVRGFAPEKAESMTVAELRTALS